LYYATPTELELLAVSFSQGGCATLGIDLERFQRTFHIPRGVANLLSHKIVPVDTRKLKLLY